MVAVVTIAYGEWRPETPIKYSASMSSLEASELIKVGKEYKLSDFNQIEEQAERSRNIIALGISRIDTGITRLIANRQSLIKLRDLEEMKTELQAKRKNYAEMKRSLKDNLAEVSRQGLWLVVIDGVSQFASKEELRTEAERALAPIAIGEINGTFLESFTRIVNNQIIQDYIRSEVSGSMQVENIHQQIHRKASGRFIYLAQISVSSLKATVDGSGMIEPGQSQASIHIVDLTRPINLVECGLSQEDQFLFRGMNDIRATISTQNEASFLRERIIINESSQHIMELAREIELLESSIENRDGRIRETVLRLTGVECTGIPEDCISRAVEVLDKKIDVLQRGKMGLKSEEIITQRTQVRPETDDPARDVAVVVAGVVSQIDKSFGKLEQFLEVTEVNNSMLTGYSILRRQDVFRCADSVWVYASPQDDETFQILVAVKFSLSLTEVIKREPSDLESNAIKIIGGVKSGLREFLWASPEEGKFYVCKGSFTYVSSAGSISIPIDQIKDICVYFKYVKIEAGGNEPFYFQFSMGASEAMRLLSTYIHGVSKEESSDLDKARQRACGIIPKKPFSLAGEDIIKVIKGVRNGTDLEEGKFYVCKGSFAYVSSTDSISIPIDQIKGIRVAYFKYVRIEAGGDEPFYFRFSMGTSEAVQLLSTYINRSSK
jgi:hypothetical protein